MHGFFLGLLLLAAPSLGVREVEIVTVTAQGFSVSFTTGTTVQAGLVYGPAEGPLTMEARESRPPSRFHIVHVRGLKPGREYRFRVRAGQTLWPPPGLPGKRVVTLIPPPGRRLFSFAVMNDIHVMEDIAGVIILPWNWLPPVSPGFTWRNPADNYWEFTLRDAVRRVRASPADFCVVNGDLTSWFTEQEFLVAKSYLDRLGMPYYVTRGNHDRMGDFKTDYFKQVFGLESSWFSIDHKGFHFVFLDDTRPEDGWMEIPEEEFEWLEEDLARHRCQYTFLFEHRPVGAGWVDVDKEQRARLLGILSRNPQVVAAFNGHSHRAKVLALPGLTGQTLHIEVPAVKEYPAGYGMVTVYEGGFMYNFHLLECPDCLEWNHITRKEYFGFAPKILGGKVHDRNAVHLFPSLCEMEAKPSSSSSAAGADFPGSLRKRTRAEPGKKAGK